MDDRHSCDSLWNLLSAYADGDVTDDEARLVDRHVDSCAECARALAFLRAVDLDLDLNDVPAPPEDLRLRILDATIHGDPARRSRPWWSVPAAMRPGLASAAVVAFIGFVWGGSLNVSTRLPWIPPPHVPHRASSLASIARRPAPPQLQPIPVYDAPVSRGYMPSRYMARPVTTLAVAPMAQARWSSIDRARPAAIQTGPRVEEPMRGAPELAPSRTIVSPVPDLNTAPSEPPNVKAVAASRVVRNDDNPPAAPPSNGTGTMRLASGEIKMGPEMMLTLGRLRMSQQEALEAQEAQKARLTDESRPDRREVKVEVSLGRF